METRRLISIILAFVAAALVVWSGKSCAESIQKANSKANGGSGVYTENYGTGYANGYERFTDSNNNDNTITQEVTTTDVTGAPVVQTVTNLLGQVVGTVTFTTTAPPQTQTRETTTVSRSILESYNEQKLTEGNDNNTSGNILERPQTTVTTTVTVEKMDPDDIILNVG